VSPESSFVNGFSADLSLFDTLEIKYIIHWSIDKKLLRHEISHVHLATPPVASNAIPQGRKVPVISTVSIVFN